MTRLELMGYTPDASCWYVIDPKHTFKLQDNRWADGHYIGLGMGAYGYCGGYAYQNATDFQQYESFITQARLPATHALKLTDGERIRRQMALGIKARNGFPLSTLVEGAPSDVREHILPKVDMLFALGCLEQVNSRIVLTPVGRLFDDEVAEIFYAPEVAGM